MSPQSQQRLGGDGGDKDTEREPRNRERRQMGTNLLRSTDTKERNPRED